MSGMDMLDDAALDDIVHGNSICTMAHVQRMALELLAHRRASQAAPAPSDGLREAVEAAAWNDAIEVVIAGIEHVKSSRSDQRIAEVDPARRERFRVAAQQCGFLIDDIRALRRAAPTEDR